jgi:hypothetical protein
MSSPSTATHWPRIAIVKPGWPGDQHPRFVNPDPKFARYLSAAHIERTLCSGIPAGEKRDVDNIVVVPLDIKNLTHRPEAKNYMPDPLYDPGTADRSNVQSISEVIVFVKTNAPDTKYAVIENCQDR